MHLHLPHLIYEGAPLDDREILSRLPTALADALRERNGCVAYLGGLHVRGACTEPAWHSIRAAWEGEDALHRLFEEVQQSDVTFAEDAFGDQFLLRDGQVMLLDAELGEVRPLKPSLEEFFLSLLEHPAELLGYEPLLEMRRQGQKLEPGQLLSARPPFVLAGTEQNIALEPTPALERRRYLAWLAGQLHGLPNGTQVELPASD
jgi:hypothetical protein